MNGSLVACGVIIFRSYTICILQSSPDRALSLTIISLPIPSCVLMGRGRALQLHSGHFFLIYSYLLGISNSLSPRKGFSSALQQSIRSSLVLPADLVSGILIRSFFLSGWKILTSLNTHPNGNSLDLHGN